MTTARVTYAEGHRARMHARRRWAVRCGSIFLRAPLPRRMGDLAVLDLTTFTGWRFGVVVYPAEWPGVRRPLLVVPRADGAPVFRRFDVEER